MALGDRDSDWADNVHDQKLTSGFLFLICGLVVSCCFYKQAVVLVSGCETEYTVMNAAGKDTICLKCLLACLPLFNSRTVPLRVLCDRQNGIKFSENESVNYLNKHIANSYNFTGLLHFVER